MAAVLLSGCASKSAYTGHNATDLQIVRPGASQTTVESAIGNPYQTEQKASLLIAWYVYDRGFVGNLEEISAGEKLLWAPVMAFGEFVSLGMAGWMTACQVPCQKGWLKVVFDQNQRVVSAEESFLPDDHPLVSKCANSVVRGDMAVCSAVRQAVRPSTLLLQQVDKIPGSSVEN